MESLKELSPAQSERAEIHISASSPSQRLKGQAIHFRSFRLEQDGSLFRGEELVHLPPKELEALRFLLSNAGQVISPLALKQALWGDVNVTADSVPKCVSSLRARLQPDNCVQTVYKRGYRLVAAVSTYAPQSAGLLPKLAVMPFAVGYSVPEHLGHSIAEEVIVRLAGLPGLPVSIIARDSVFTLAERGLTAQQLGAELKADFVLTGTIRILPAHHRLRAEMVRVSDGTQHWVEDLLVPRTHFAGLETQLAARVAFRLGLAVTSSLPSIDISAAPQRREAYEYFQRAHYEWQTLERHRMQDGLQHLSRATELDPSLVAAKVDLAHLCVTQAFYGFMSPRASAGLIRRTAESIPELPLQAEEILPALGWVSFHFDRDFSAALEALSQSSHLPHDPWTTRIRSMIALSRHRFDEAIDILRAALRLDPYSPWIHNRLAWAYHLNRQTEFSLKQIGDSVARFPGHEATSLYGVVILAFNGFTDRALELGQNLVARLPHFDLAASVHAYSLACAGRKDEARTIMERLQWLSRERFAMKSFNAAAYLALDDPETALSELRAANDDRCPWFFQMLADPRLAPLFHRPEFCEFASLLTRMESLATPSELICE